MAGGTGKICTDRTTMFPVVDMPVSTCYHVITAMMTEQFCNNIVIMRF